jgi:hypothetical protein
MNEGGFLLLPRVEVRHADGMSIGFKEWALVCDEIERGGQSIIIRKGGIHEGREGFRFEHAEFFLFPTLFHEQCSKLKLPGGTPMPVRDAGDIAVRLFARVEWTELVTDPERALALSPFHIWQDEVVSQRFHYGEPPGIHVAFLRAYHLAQPWTFPDAPEYGGCRSWVTLPEAPANIPQIPVLDDEEHGRRADAVRSALRK